MLKSVVKHTMDPAISHNVDTQMQISKLTFTRAATQLTSQRSQPAEGRTGSHQLRKHSVPALNATL